MSVLFLYVKQFQALRTIVMVLDGMDVSSRLATLQKLGGITLFQAVSDFKNLVMGLRGMDSSKLGISPNI